MTRATDLTCDAAGLSSVLTTQTFDNQQRYKRDKHERADYSHDGGQSYASIHSTSVPTTILIEARTTAHLVLAAVLVPSSCPTSHTVHFECLT